MLISGMHFFQQKVDNMRKHQIAKHSTNKHLLGIRLYSKQLTKIVDRSYKRQPREIGKNHKIPLYQSKFDKRKKTGIHHPKENDGCRDHKDW